MSARPAGRDPLQINVGLIGVGVVGSAVLDFFAREPLDIPIPGAGFGEPSGARIRLWSAARRSRHNPKGADEALIGRVVSHDEAGRPRFYYDIDPHATSPGKGSEGASWRRVVADGAVDIVVEATGSPLGEAIIEEALWRGKSVVTANKAVLSRSGYELVRLAQSRGAALTYEASVGGGMPVIQVIGGAIGGRVTAMLAILNGTTNFILSEMRRAAMAGESVAAAYPAAVCGATHQGLAEADPSADVLGEDPRSKIIILAGLAFGVRLRPREVYVRGIARKGYGAPPDPAQRALFHSCPGSGGRPCREVCGSDDHISTRPILHVADLRLMDRMGYVPKLLAGAQLAPAPDGRAEQVVAWVQPCAVPAAHPLAGVDGSENACLLDVESPVSGGPAKRYPVFLRGPGAGGPETASSVMADIEFCARQIAATSRQGVDQTRRGAGTPLFMYGAGAFQFTQPVGRSSALWSRTDLTAPFLLRFVGAGSEAPAVAGALAKGGLEATPLDPVEGFADHRYFRTGPASVRKVEEGIEEALRACEPGRASADVLYLPILKETRWQAQPAG